jgi:hypothetical protein
MVGAKPLLGLVRLGIGGIAGSLLAGGAWALFLWREYGSPTFPFYNGIFHAPEGPDANLFDERFLPTGLLDALLYPAYALLGIYRTTEIPYRDARFAILAVLALVVLAVHAAHRARSPARVGAVPLAPVRPYAAFLIISYIVWMAQFAIQRYAVVLEMLTGPAIIALIDHLLRGRPKLVVATIITAGAIAWTQPPDWAHRKWSRPYQGPALPEALEQPAAVFLVGKPLGHLAVYLHPESRLYQLAENTIRPEGRFEQLIKVGLDRAWPGGIWIVHFEGDAPGDDVLEQLRRYGVEPEADPAACVKLEDGLFGDPVACPLRRL